NTAAVATPGDNDAANNNGSDSVIVTANVAPDLIVTKTHTGNFVVGTPGIFTLAVTNIGTGPTTGTITLIDTLPAELDYVSATGAGWTCNLTTAGPPNDVVTCTHPGPLAVGVTLSVDLTVDPLTDVGSPFINDVSVSTPGESNTANNTDTDSVIVTAAPAPDLTITKTHVGNFTVGVNSNFTLTVRNTGSGPTTAAITVTDTLPAGLTFVSVSGTGWDCSATVAPNVSCTHPGPVAAGGVLPDLTLTVTPTVATPPAILNTANVTTAGDINGGNNASTDTVIVASAPGPDLTIVKSHLSNFVVGVNGLYTFRVSNVGSVATTAVITVTDTLQTGLAFVSASSADTNWDCSGSAGVNVVCTHPGPLAAGASLADLDLTVSVGAAALGSFNNVATVATTGDANTGNNSSINPTTVTATPQPDLEITKSRTGTFAIGTQGTYTINVRNVGSAATTGAITVTDTLQTGLTLVSATGTNWFCGATGQTVTCNYQMPPAAPPNSGEVLPSITILVNVGLPALGVFNNVAVVTTPGDNNPANDTAINQTIVPFTIDLSLTAAVNTATPNVGDTVVFTVTVTNAGPHDATNVTISGILPNVSIVSVTPSQGTFNQGTGVWTVGTVLVGGTQTLVISATVANASPTGFTAQVSTANETDVDSTPGNNVASEDDQASVAITPATPSGGPLPIVVDPAIAKRLPIENAVIGDPVEFIITVTNPNSVPVLNVTVSDPLPTLVDFVGASMTQGTFSYDSASHTVTFDIGTMAAGQVVEIRVQTVVNQRGQPPTEMCNEAELRVGGQSRGKSNAACAYILPGIIPETGVGPGRREWLLTLGLWMLAWALPVSAWLVWRKLRDKRVS
ncbi:MAG TPA: hypothetical protein VI547_00480, partial [Anaerolineales bacterium]|nr:hypothetical protein [Anaerolineales bacterium]